MRHVTAECLGRGGRRLFTQRWLPDCAARGSVVIAHGLAEHSSRYVELASHLVSIGYAVHALDHRGHGRSDGARSYVEAFDWVVDDLVQFVRAARDRDPASRVSLLGHSFGGAVALLAALGEPDLVGRLVLSAPAIGADPGIPLARLALGRLLSVVAPRAGILKLPAAGISRDAAVVRAYETDPLVYRGAIPARTLVELLAAMRRISELAPSLAVPTLVMHGTADRLVPLKFTEPVYARLGSRDLTIKLYDGYYHEIFNEPGRARVIADLEAWLDTRD